MLCSFFLQLGVVAVLKSSENLLNRIEQVEKSTIVVLEEALQYTIYAFGSRGYLNTKIAVVLDRKVGEFEINR